MSERMQVGLFLTIGLGANDLPSCAHEVGVLNHVTSSTGKYADVSSMPGQTKRLIAESGRDDIKVKFTGLRPGERLHEVLFSEVEDGSASAHPLISEVLV